MNDVQKGELIGYTIGRYGVDIFAGAVTGTAAGKGVQYANKMVPLFRNLRNANRACNLETMTISSANKEKIVAESLKHAAAKESYFKNVKYNFDAHNKHIRDHNDFIKTGSEWQHKDPEGLLKRFAGTGVSGGNKQPGICGYKETVDFKEHIGVWKSRDGIELPTTRGTIHYGNKGAHIVPSNPNPIIMK